ncbi:MAG: LysE family transporter [Geminicoccaceae bacterium]|nr:LysE family transporter [Geminicoccaceae bacterium]
MGASIYFSIFLASAINAAIPGPCVAMTIGTSARYGLAAGFAVSAGVIVADAILGAVALATLAGLMHMSDAAYAFMKWFGVVVLSFIGLRILLGSRSSFDTSSTLKRSNDHLIPGILVGLSSPYNLVFLLALLPGFIPGEDLTWANGMLLISMVMFGALISQIGATLIGFMSGTVFQKKARQIESAGAFCMLGFAAMAAFV